MAIPLFVNHSPAGYVKHREFSRSDLNGKRVAYCLGGDSLEYYFQAGKERGDGHFELRAIAQVLDSSSNPEKRITSRPSVIELGQDTVDKIVKPQSSSYLHQMGYEFAIVPDSESAYLVAAQKSQKPI